MISENYRDEIIHLTQELIRIKSYPGDEKAVIQFIGNKMSELGFDTVRYDEMGNVIGKMGNGPIEILFDSHLDTVEVNDEEKWEHPPFEGKIVDDVLYGRGSVDMKSSAAASIYAAVIAKDHDLLEGLTVYVSCTILEEDCDGENLKHLLKEFDLSPDYVIICEPSNNKIALGHKGKVQIAITTKGISAHGSMPEKGVNAVYEMAEIIKRVEELSMNLPTIGGQKGSLVLSRITSVSASLNAVPTACEIYLDRRLVLGESTEQVKEEMDSLVDGIDATWNIGTLHRTSWTGLEITYKPVHEAWSIERDHPLAIACDQAYEIQFKKKPDHTFWDFSTNAVTPVSLGLPTIGFGPGNPDLAHMRNEHIPLDSIIDACGFYVSLLGKI